MTIVSWLLLFLHYLGEPVITEEGASTLMEGTASTIVEKTGSALQDGYIFEFLSIIYSCLYDGAGQFLQYFPLHLEQRTILSLK